MEEFSVIESNLSKGSSENSQHEVRESLAGGFLSAEKQHDNFEIFESSDVSVSMLPGVELAEFANKFSNVESSKCNNGYALLFGISVVVFVVITISNFISDPTLFFSSSDDVKEGTIKFFGFLLLIVLLYVPFISAIVLVLFGLRKHIPKIVSIAFRVVSYGLIIFASFRLLISNPIAFLLLVAGVACIWFRKWLACSIDIIENFLRDSLLMYESFPKFTGLVFLGFLADTFLVNVMTKIIELTHIHYGVEYFGHDLGVELDSESSASPTSLLILGSLHLGDTFIGSVTSSILIAAFISAYCLLQYQKDAPPGTPSYKDINFFKLFYTKNFGSMCCTSVLPIITECIKTFSHIMIPKYGPTLNVFLTIFRCIFDMIMCFLDTSALSHMILNETGYFQSLRHVINIFRQKRWYILKNVLLINASLVIFVVPIIAIESLLIFGCEVLFSFIFKTDFSSLEKSEFFDGIGGSLAGMINVLGICRFIVPILMSQSVETQVQNNYVELQNVQADSEQSSKKV